VKPKKSRKLDEKEELLLETATGYSTENGFFYKSADERTSPSRFGETYDSMEEEFQALKRLKAVAPEFFVTPVAMTYDGNGNPAGYFMENAPGHELNDFTQTYTSQSSQNLDLDNLDTDFVQEQVRFLDTVMDLYGEAHGDLKPWNIKVDPETSRIRGYDPVGFDSDVAATVEARKEDRKEVMKIISDLETAS
jgi:hypothetical protein